MGLSMSGKTSVLQDSSLALKPSYFSPDDSRWHWPRQMDMTGVLQKGRPVFVSGVECPPTRESGLQLQLENWRRTRLRLPKPWRLLYVHDKHRVWLKIMAQSHKSAR